MIKNIFGLLIVSLFISCKSNKAIVETDSKYYTDSIYSNSLSEYRKHNTYLPKGFNAKNDYPIVYATDGFTINKNSFLKKSLDLLIENNVIENCVYGGNGAQAIFLIDPQYVDKKNFEGKYSKNITIRNNTIKTFDSSILVAMSVDGLTFENNEIIQTDTYKPIFPNTDNVQIINCNNVLIKGNTYKKIDGKETSITIDEKSTNVNVAKGDAFKKKPSKK